VSSNRPWTRSWQRSERILGFGSNDAPADRLVAPEREWISSHPSELRCVDRHWNQQSQHHPASSAEYDKQRPQGRRRRAQGDDFSKLLQSRPIAHVIVRQKATPLFSGRLPKARGGVEFTLRMEMARRLEGDPKLAAVRSLGLSTAFSGPQRTTYRDRPPRLGSRCRAWANPRLTWSQETFAIMSGIG